MEFETPVLPGIKRKRVFIGVHEISGNYTSLAAGLRKLGYDVTLTFREKHPFSYGFAGSIPSKDAELKLIRDSVLNDSLPQIFHVPLRALLFCVRLATRDVLRLSWAVRMFVEHDVFIFGFGTSLLELNLDLPILKLSRKTVISNIEHGSEALPPAGDGAWLENEGSFLSAQQLRKLTRTNKRRVRTHEKFATFVIGNPLSTSYFATERFVNGYFLGRPLETHNYLEFQKVSPSSSLKRLRILHAPSHAPCKGSKEIEELLAELRAEGHEFDYIRAENLPNRKVLGLISSSDFVIDQVYSDRYWPKVSAEAALLGKPTVIGGYGFNLLDSITAENMRPPVLAVHPDKLKSAVRQLLLSSSFREELGYKAREFANDNYSCEKVASRYALLFESGKVPNQWWVQPQNVPYLGGCGQHLDRTMRNYKVLISELGATALGLDHKPEFRDFLIQAVKRETIQNSMPADFLP